jgi:hypothetical protein
VCRINRMLNSEPGQASSRSSLVDSQSFMMSPLVQCPLCRERTPANQAIKNVHAGDSVQLCCVCTETRSDVCLPCGHLCLCQICFSQLPRISAHVA